MNNLLQMIDTSTAGYGMRVLDPVLAISIGNVTAALLVQQLDHWLQKGMGFYYEGRNWVWNTLENWRDKSNLPFLSIKQIRNAIALLEDLGVVKKEFLSNIHRKHSCCAYNRTLYYTIDYKRLNELLCRYLPNSANDNAPSSEVNCQYRQTYTKTTSKDNFQKQAHSQERECQQEEIFRKPEEIQQPRGDYSSPSVEQNDYAVKEILLEAATTPPPVVRKKLKIKQQPKVFHGPWQSRQEMKSFYRDLVAALPRLGARNSEAVAAKIIQNMRNGLPCTYWDDWKEGRAIGTASMQEWEVAPGVVAPKFVEYLKEKTRNAHDSNEKALEGVLKLLKDKSTALAFWLEFKRSVEVLRQDNEKAVAEGRQPYIPAWFIDRADVSVERAATSANYLNDVNPTSDWVNEKMEGETSTHLLPQSDFDAALNAAVRGLREAAEHGYVSSAKRYVAIALNVAKSEEDKARLNRAITDIYPNLLEEN